MTTADTAAQTAEPRIAPVALFSGHLFDRVGRASPRLPVRAAAAAERKIAGFFDRLRPRAAWVSLSCGADILFAQAALSRAVPLSLVVAVDVECSLAEVDEVAANLEMAGESGVSGGWLERARVIVEGVKRESIHELRCPEATDSGEPYRRANEAMDTLALEQAAAMGGAVAPLVVWDGRTGDVGGTSDVVAAWRGRGVEVTVIEAGELREERP